MTKTLQETGVVSFIKDGYAYLKTDSASACGNCSSKGSCSSGRMNFINSDYTIRVQNRVNLKQGDEVILDMSSNKLLFGSVLVYLLPLLFLFLFASIANIIGGEIYSIFAGLGGVFIGLIIAKIIISIKKVARQFEPLVQEKIFEDNECML